MLVLNTYVFIYEGCYAVCYDVFVASGATTSEMKLVPHEPRVGLDTLHDLGRVVFAYVFEVNTCWCICVLSD